MDKQYWEDELRVAKHMQAKEQAESDAAGVPTAGLAIWRARAMTIESILLEAPDSFREQPMVPQPMFSDEQWKENLHAAISREVHSCTACEFHKARRAAVPAGGSLYSSTAIVGSAPGDEEDKWGRPFVGPAGKILDGLLEAAGLPPQSACYVTNAIKCMPPGGTSSGTVEPKHLQACSGYLRRQLDIVQPRVILVMGGDAATSLLKINRRGCQYGDATAAKIIDNPTVGALRTQEWWWWHYPVVVTYHPSWIDRTSDSREQMTKWQTVLEDLKKVRQFLTMTTGEINDRRAKFYERQNGMYQGDTQSSSYHVGPQ